MISGSQNSNVVLGFKAEGAAATGASDYREMGWKGLGQAADSIEGRKESTPEDGLDMTPMVDVTFLLLIFFMVTASFVVQKSIAQPPFRADASSPAPVDQEVVTVVIDSNSMFYVTSRDEDEVECPSEREMRTRVSEAQKISNVDRMTILAHVDSMHKKVISAWDAGVVAGIEKISIETTEEEL